MKGLVVMMLIGMFALVGCSTNKDSSSTDQTTTPAPVPAEYAGLKNPLATGAAKEGAKVFKTNCETCHGSQGHGDGPAGQSLEPRRRNLAELQHAATDDYLFWRIREGKPGTSMVAWKGILTDEQIWQAVSFIRTLK